MLHLWVTANLPDIVLVVVVVVVGVRAEYIYLLMQMCRKLRLVLRLVTIWKKVIIFKYNL